MTTIKASQIKTGGIQSLDTELARDGVVAVTVRGSVAYFVMSPAHYDDLAADELAMAVRETEADYAAGRYTTDIKKHLAAVAKSCRSR